MSIDDFDETIIVVSRRLWSLDTINAVGLDTRVGQIWTKDVGTINRDSDDKVEGDETELTVSTKRREEQDASSLLTIISLIGSSTNVENRLHVLEHWYICIYGQHSAALCSSCESQSAQDTHAPPKGCRNRSRQGIV